MGSEDVASEKGRDLGKASSPITRAKNKSLKSNGTALSVHKEAVSTFKDLERDTMKDYDSKNFSASWRKIQLEKQVRNSPSHERDSNNIEVLTKMYDRLSLQSMTSLCSNVGIGDRQRAFSDLKQRESFALGHLSKSGQKLRDEIMIDPISRSKSAPIVDVDMSSSEMNEIMNKFETLKSQMMKKEFSIFASETSSIRDRLSNVSSDTQRRTSELLGIGRLKQIISSKSISRRRVEYNSWIELFMNEKLFPETKWISLSPLNMYQSLLEIVRHDKKRAKRLVDIGVLNLLQSNQNSSDLQAYVLLVAVCLIRHGFPVDQLMEGFIVKKVVLSKVSIDALFRYMCGELNTSTYLQNEHFCDEILSQTVTSPEVYYTLLQLCGTMENTSDIIPPLTSLVLLVTSNPKNKKMLLNEKTLNLSMRLLPSIRSKSNSKLFSLLIYLVSGCIHQTIGTMSGKLCSKFLQDTKQILESLKFEEESQSNMFRLILFGSLHRNLEVDTTEILDYQHPIFENTFILLSFVLKYVVNFKDSPLQVGDEGLFPDLILVKASLAILRKRTSKSFIDLMSESPNYSLEKEINFKMNSYMLFFEDLNDYCEYLSGTLQLKEEEFIEIITRIACSITDSFWKPKFYILKALSKAKYHTRRFLELERTYKDQFPQNRSSLSLASIADLESTITAGKTSSSLFGSIEKQLVLRISQTFSSL